MLARNQSANTHENNQRYTRATRAKCTMCIKHETRVDTREPRGAQSARKRQSLPIRAIKLIAQTTTICSTAHSCYPSHIFHCRKHVTITLRGNTYKSSQGTCASNSEMLSSGDHYRSDPVQVQSQCDLSVPNHNQMLCVLHVCLVF